MSVRFVIGRAGTGKTHHCLTAIREALQREPLGDMGLILLTPEQASLQMERALLTGPVRATHRAQVLSFTRLAFRILQEAGAPQRQALSPAGRAMVIRVLLERLAPKLRYYRGVDRLTGFCAQVGRALGEFIAEAVEPGALRTAAEEAAPNRQRAAKLADLADLYEAYRAYLGTQRLDPSQYLELAREALPRCTFLRDARIWVDGFAGFTQQELSLLADIARQAAGVEITALVDPAYHAAQTERDALDSADLFAKAQRTCLSLHDRLRRAGLDFELPLLLEPATNPRFAAAPELAQLEHNFSPEPASEVEPTAAAPHSVHLFEAPDRRVEVDFAVSQVCRWVQETDGDLRYRDVAIVVRDLDPYHDLLTAALAERNIPFFIDRRRSVAHHPLVEFVRGALQVVATGFGIDAVRALLKTNLLGLDIDIADELENYILRYGMTGIPQWTGDDWTFCARGRESRPPTAADRSFLLRVNDARRRIVTMIGPVLLLRENAAAGIDWANALRDLLAQSAVRSELDAWAQHAEANGAADEAEEHRAALTETTSLLDELADALGSNLLDVSATGEVLEAGLAELTLGMIPPTIDQILVGSIERSRHPEIKAAIVLGFNDGTFPLTPTEDPVLTDDDRLFLADRQLELGATRQQQVMEEALLAYIAVTRPSRKLLITWARSDTQGRALRSSPYVRLLTRALPGLRTQSLVAPEQSRATWPIMTGRDLAASLAAEMRRRPSPTDDDDPKRSLWNDLYTLACAHDSTRRALPRAVSALTYLNEAELAPASVAKLIPETYTASVTELETFAACPFQRFARYGLRLEERKEADLEPVDVGTVHHAILEDFFNEALARKENFAHVQADEVLDRLQASAERIGEDMRQSGEIPTPRDTYVLKRSARDLAPIVRHQQRVAQAGSFQPQAAEKKFGFGDPQSLPPLQINTPLGRKVFIRGLIDRVDLADLGEELLGVVVDYKRMRHKQLDLSGVYHGLSLQLLGYLLSLAEQGETLAGRPIQPLGAFYVSLLRKYRPVDHPDDAEEDTPEAQTPRGIFDAGRYHLLEQNADTGWSKLFKIFRKRDGSLGHIDRGDAAGPAQFASVLAHTRRKLGQLADGVLDGDVSVSPYRLNDFSPCHWCRMRSVCRFEFGDHGMRHLDALTRSDAFKQMEGEAS